jgi:quercetin dioxygenase-like cupin family protein
MRVGVITCILACVAVAGLTAQAGRQAVSESAKHEIVPADKVTFAPIEVPGFKSGMKIAVIHGDPNAESGMYVIRLQFPAGYTFPPHWHPMAENLTVLSGTFMLGMGEKADTSNLATYMPGAFLYIPGKMAHFGGAKGETIVQLHGQAPFKIELVK